MGSLFTWIAQGKLARADANMGRCGCGSALLTWKVNSLPVVVFSFLAILPAGSQVQKPAVVDLSPIEHGGHLAITNGFPLAGGLQGVQLLGVADKSMLVGTVGTATEQARVHELASELGVPANISIRVPGNSDRDAAQIMAILGKALPSVTARGVENLVVLEGSVPTLESLSMAEAVARKVSGERFLNLIQLRPPDRKIVEIDVTIAEINWGNFKSIGNNELFNSISAVGVAKLSWDVFSTEVTRTMGTNSVKRQEETHRYDGDETLTISAHTRLNALVEANCARIISTPHLTLLEGNQGSINVGGAFGFPLITANYSGIAYEKYGTLLKIALLQVKGGYIECQLSIERSQPPNVVEVDRTRDSLSPDGINRPMTQTDSVLVMESNETRVISGLIESAVIHVDSRTPILHRVPVANLFFKHKGDEVVQKEVVILVTPRLEPLPVRKNDAVPTSGYYVDAHFPHSPFCPPNEQELVEFAFPSGAEGQLPHAYGTFQRQWPMVPAPEQPAMEGRSGEGLILPPSESIALDSSFAEPAPARPNFDESFRGPSLGAQPSREASDFGYTVDGEMPPFPYRN